MTRTEEFLQETVRSVAVIVQKGSSADQRGQPLPQASQVQAGAVAKVFSTRQELLAFLLDATLPGAHRGRPVLWPLWANEAMQRAYGLVRLVARLEQNVPFRTCDLAAARAECRLACELAATFRALDVADDEQVLPCSDLLRTLVRDLVELFSPIAGGVNVRTSIEPLLLPVYKRRALVLAGYALVTDVLGSELSHRGGGEVTVGLSRVTKARALLRVVDSGRSVRGDDCIRPSEVVVDLAALLESDPVYRIGAAGGMAVEIVFPV
jgi:hypothetical protein